MVEEDYRTRMDKYNKIAQKMYTKNYREICADKQRIVKTLYLAGGYLKESE